MKWYVAHCIMLFRFKDGNQDAFPVEENMFLIQAESFEAARGAAGVIAKAEEILDDPGMETSGRPVSVVFAGIRKVVECFPDGISPTNGSELTYNELEFSDEESFRMFLNGETVTAIVD